MKQTRPNSQPVPHGRGGERGAAMVVSVVGMLALVLATGLAVDISHFYTAKAELQTAADAAALAAASQINSTKGGIKLAVAEGTRAMNKYDFKNNVVLTSSNFVFATNVNGPYVDYAAAQAAPTTVRFVKVTVPDKPVGVTFASIVIGGTKNIGATATAGLSVGLTMNKFYTAFTFVEATAAPLAPGSTYTLAPKGWNNKDANSYRVLTLPDGSNGSDLVVTGTIHAYGYTDGGYKVAQLNATSPAGSPNSASMCRAAKIGVNTRFGDYGVHPNADADGEPADTVTDEDLTYQQYRDKQPTITSPPAGTARNRRIITLPIVQQPDYNTSTRNVTADRFGAFFIRRKIGSDCAFEVEYIGKPMAVPVGTYTPGDPQSSELSIPVLYK